MKYSNSIEYNISTKLDSSGLTKLQTQIREVELSLQKMSNAGNFAPTIEKARSSLQGLNKALTEAFNPSLGIIDISKFRAELAAGKVDLESVASGFRLAGTQGQTAFNSLIGQLGRFDAGITRTSSAIDKMFVTFQNTFRWGLISSFFSQFMNAIHSSVEYARELDDSLTQIMLVTDYSRDSMNEYAKAANEAAKAVGQTTVGMTNASLIFAQQGYDLDRSQQLATLSAKLANASQQDTAATSDQITAYMNAYGLQDDLEALSQAMDNWALIANISAADVEEIALASQRAASMANAVGVSGEALAAQIATIESVTREAPEQIGNGLKTLYARFSDLQLGKEDEDGIGLGKVTATLQQIGVQVLDSLGNVRNMDDIMEDLMTIWQDLDDTTQEAVAQTLAGKHQVNRFTALMDNADMYQEYLGATGENASGTLEQMNQEYMDSLQGRMATLQATLESLFNDVFTTDMIYPLIDALTKLAEVFDTLFKSIGGGPTIILGLASAFTRLFSKNIANAITDASMNRELSRIQAENYKNAPAALSQLGLANPDANNENTKSLLNFAQQGAQLSSTMSEEGLKQYNSLLDENARLTDAAENAHKEFIDTLSSLNAILGTTIQETDAIFTDENGLNTSVLTEVLRELKDDDFEGNKEKIKGVVDEIKNYITALENLETEIKEYKKIEDSAGEGPIKINDAVQRVREAAIEIGRVGGLSKEQLEALKKSINDVDTQTENWENEAKDALAEIQRLAGGAENLKKILEQLSNSKSLSPEKARALADQLDRTYSNDQAAQGAKDNIDRLSQGFLSTQELANLRKETLDFVGALGQVAFAIQSIQNLGKIWKDEDLSFTEKLTQSFLNLSMVIPSLITAFDKLKNVNSVIQLLTVTQNRLIASAFRASSAENGFVISNMAVATSSGIAAVAVGALQKALQLLTTTPWGIVVAGFIMGIARAFDDAKKAAEEAKEKVQESVNSFNNDYQKINIDISNFEELYDQYVETGIASDELVKAGERLSEELGIVGGSALAASGNFSELKNEIINTQKEAQDLAEMHADQAINNIYQRANRDDSGKPWEDINLNYNEWNAMSAAEEAGIYRAEIQKKRELVNSDAAYMREMENRYGNNNIETWEERDRELYQIASDRYERTSADITRMEAVFIDLFGDLDTVLKPLADQQISNLSTSDFENMNYSDIEAILTDSNGPYKWIADIIAASTPEVAQSILDGIIRTVNPEALVDNRFELAQQQLDNNIIPGGQSALDQIKEWRDIFNISDDDLIQLVDIFDWSNPQELIKRFAQYAPAIEEGLRQGLSVDEILANMSAGEITLDPNAFQYTDEQITEIMKKAGLEDVPLDSYVQTFKDMGGAGIDSGEINTVREHIDDLTASLEREREALKEIPKNTPEYDKQVKQIKAMQNELDQANEHLEHLAISALETSNGLDELSSRWNDISDAINNSASPGELTATYEELRNILAQILNVDPSAITQSFMESASVLESLGRLAEGDLTAINDLRAAFAEPFNIKTYLDTIGFEGDVTTLLGLIDQAQAALPDLEVGAYLEDEQFLNALTEMVMSGQIAAEDIKNIFEGLGYDVQVHYDTEMTFPNVMAHMEARKMTGADDMAMETAYAALDHSVTDGTTVQVPRFEFTPKGGGGGGHNFRKNTGGSGKGGSCFIAGTLVSLQNSFKEIEKIQVGDIVLSYNEENHRNEYSRVLQTMIHNTTEEIYDLYIEDETLSVTGIHRFYIRRKHDIEWIMASELNVGDYVLFANGNWHVISNINIKIQTTTVYNFEVSDNHNYYVGRNQILAHNKGGGGGGGSKAKTIQPKEKKEHKKDYYEKVNSQLDKLKEQLSGIEKQEDKLIGDKARANQQKQINLIRQEIKLEEERLKILQDTADSELKDVKAAMEAKDKLAEDILKGRGINFNIPAPEYDENGIITNYEAISTKIDEAHNKLIDQYNAAAAAGNEDLTKTIDEAIKKYDDYSAAILENAKRQNDIQKEIESTKNTIQELKDSITDIDIELYKTSMETIDNLKDLNEKWAEFQGFLTSMPSDSPFRELTVDLLKLNTSFEIGREDAEKYYQEIINGKLAAQDATDDKAEKEAIQASINYFTGLKEGLTDDMLKNGLLGLAMTDLEELEKWYKDPSLKDNPFKDNQKALVEAYQEGYERVLELSQDWQDLQENIVNNVIDGFDEIADKQDCQLEKYDHLAEELESLADTYALSYGDESYKALSDIGKRQAETLKAQLSQYVNIYDYWEKRYEDAIGTGNEELINSIEDRMNDVRDEMRDLAQESAEAFVEAYENAMDAAVQDMYQNLFGENNLDHLDRNWEWDKKIIDNYRDEVEKTFEIEQLRSKYNDLLNDAQGSSLATQNKIRKQMQEQLDLLKNQESMSEYDVQLANSKLLILQKQIALEDAQQNKNQMQLRRDSQGNYRYVYRASQNDIAKARQEYMQAVQDAYELTKEQRQKTAEELSNTLKDYANEWRDLSTNMNLTEEERLNQSKELTIKFLEYMKHLNEDLTDSQLGMSDVLNFMVENGTADVAAAAQQMLGQLFDDQGNLIEDTNIAWWDFGNDLAKKLFPYIEDATSTMNSTLEKEADELREKLTGPDGVIKEVTNAIAGEDGLRPALEDATKAIVGENGLDAAMDSLADSLENQNKKLTEGMENIEKYTKGLAAALDWLKTAQNAIKDLQDITVGELVSETSAPLPEEAKPKEEPKPAAATTTTTAKPAAKPATNTNKLNKDRVLAAYNEIMSGRAGNGDARWRYLTNKGYTNAEQDAAQAVVNAVYGGSGRDAALKRTVGYASGGYTGEWNKDGKLAFLHQKELVLNAEDTRNILSAVDIVRQMTSTLGNALTNYSIGGAKNSLMNSAFGAVDQRVEIKAEFPNVRDAFEIETALTNLADTAYQYAHRKI